jgi:N-acetylmuramoyl-L-alanine amidase
MTKVLVLDAGHGGNGSTAGKRTLNGSNGVIYEWNLNNNVCNYIAEILKDYDVTMLSILVLSTSTSNFVALLSSICDNCALVSAKRLSIS